MRKHVYGIVAIMMAVGAFAFTPAPAKKGNSYFFPSWYYKLSTVAGENTRTNYEALSNQASGCPGSSQVRCVISAPDHLTGGIPDGTPDLSDPAKVTVISKKP